MVDYIRELIRWKESQRFNFSFPHACITNNKIKKKGKRSNNFALKLPSKSEVGRVRANACDLRQGAYFEKRQGEKGTLSLPKGKTWKWSNTC